MTAAAEVIDLTGLSSSPPTHSHHDDRTPYADRTAEQPKNTAIGKGAGVALEDGEFTRAEKPTNTSPRKQRKRKKSQQDPATTKGENVESGDNRRRRVDEPGELSRGNSPFPPDRVSRRHTLRERPSESLFFVDDQPANIRDPYISASLAGPSRAQQNGGLILPPHVKIADGSSEAQESSLVVMSDAEEGDEDFIDYLDVDGDRSVGISLAEPLPLCTLIQKRKDWSCSLLS